MPKSKNDIMEELSCLLKILDKRVEELYSEDVQRISSLVNKITIENEVFKKGFVSFSKWGDITVSKAKDACNKTHYSGVYLFLYPLAEEDQDVVRKKILDLYNKEKKMKVPAKNDNHNSDIIELEGKKYILLYVGRSYRALQSRMKNHIWGASNSSTYSLKLGAFLSQNQDLLYLKKVKIFTLYQTKKVVTDSAIETMKYDMLITKLEKYLHENYPPLLGTSR